MNNFLFNQWTFIVVCTYMVINDMIIFKKIHFWLLKIILSSSVRYQIFDIISLYCKEILKDRNNLIWHHPSSDVEFISIGTLTFAFRITQPLICLTWCITYLLFCFLCQIHTPSLHLQPDHSKYYFKLILIFFHAICCIRI